eukprot:TRINITY_DN10247_c0_g1_i2.p1 TRINITY_DN10247_c0_g1~~TRINITY_DN10247_c0_g1_i2.p1  ORF type:complete len:144 (-),score=32.06 TRINITY_DN10247_c0_g1_i2:415-846(-)
MESSSAIAMLAKRSNDFSVLIMPFIVPDEPSSRISAADLLRIAAQRRSDTFKSPSATEKEDAASKIQFGKKFLLHVDNAGAIAVIPCTITARDNLNELAARIVARHSGLLQADVADAPRLTAIVLEALRAAAECMTEVPQARL